MCNLETRLHETSTLPRYNSKVLLLNLDIFSAVLNFCSTEWRNIFYIYSNTFTFIYTLTYGRGLELCVKHFFKLSFFEFLCKNNDFKNIFLTFIEEFTKNSNYHNRLCFPDYMRQHSQFLRKYIYIGLFK